jgi:hypothetical protein
MCKAEIDAFDVEIARGRSKEDQIIVSPAHPASADKKLPKTRRHSGALANMHTVLSGEGILGKLPEWSEESKPKDASPRSFKN